MATEARPASGPRRLIVSVALVLASALAAHAVERPCFGGTVVVAGEHDVGVDLAPGELDTPVGRTVARALYSTLFRVDGSGRVLPHLLASASARREGREWQLDLTPGVLFHDGSAVTAEDVIATLERWARTSPGGAEGCLAEIGRDADRARVVTDGGAVRVLLSEPCPHLDLELADPAVGVLPAALARSGGPMPRPIGSGPFRVAADPGGHAVRDANGTLVLEAFPEHFRGRPFLDRVEIRPGLARPDRRTELRIGSLDVALGSGLEPGDDASWTRGGASTVFLVANPVTIGPAARSEIAGFLDRDLIAEVILGGRARRADEPIPPSLLPVGPLLPPIPARTDRAPDRPHRVVELAVALEDLPLDLVAQRLQADLDALGLDVRLVRVERDQLEWSMRSGGFALAVVERVLPDGSPLGSIGRVLATWRPSPGDRARELAVAASGAPDVAAGLERLLLAERAFVEQAVWIPVVHRELGASHATGVHVGRVLADGSLALDSVWRRAP